MKKNTRQSTTQVCGTCQNWNGEREVIEKEQNNHVKQYVECAKEGYCDYKKSKTKNGARCTGYQKWYNLD